MNSFIDENKNRQDESISTVLAQSVNRKKAAVQYYQAEKVQEQLKHGKAYQGTGETSKK